MVVSPSTKDEVPYFDPQDPEFHRDPYPTYARLRSHRPIYWSEKMGMWVATRYGTCATLLKDPRLGRDAIPGIEHLHGPGAIQEPVFHFLWLSLLMRDPPDHTRLRGLVTKAFTARRVEAMRPRIRAIAHELLDTVAPRGAMDIIHDFAHPLPVTVICDMLGIPEGDRGRFLGGAFINPRIVDPMPLARREIDQENNVVLELRDYFEHLFARRRCDPGDDLITALLHAEGEEGRLSEEEVFANIWLLLAAGHETTRNLIGNGLLALHRNPAQLQRLKDQPELMPNAVEELLRYDSPVQLGGRTALEEVDVGGMTVPRGGMVVMMLGAANRDPERFTDPDRLDVGRSGATSLSFGGGIHFCLGAQLSRIETAIALDVLLHRFPCLELNDIDHPAWKPGISLRGLDVLPAHWS
jgi:cytochrome P450